VLVAFAATACAARQHASVNRRAATFKEFNDRVGRYVELHKRLEKDLPPLPTKADAAAIAKHKSALSEAIRGERKGARQGDIFFPAAARLIREILVAEMHGPAGKEERKTIKEGNPKTEGPTAPVKLAVNTPYPDKAPLSSVPAGVLLNLPKLPEEVEYRFVGRHMILHDVAANLIVDFLWEAAPKS
jgi:hypothetical protein